MPRWFYWSAIAILIAGLAAIGGIGATRYFEALDEQAKSDLPKAQLPSDDNADVRATQMMTQLDVETEYQAARLSTDAPNAVRPLPDGSVLLAASTAELSGGLRYLSSDQTAGANEVLDAIVGWTATTGAAQWEFFTDRPGLFTIEIVYAAQPTPIPATYVIEYDTYKLEQQLVRSSGSWQEFLTEYPGTIKLIPAGKHTLRISSSNVEGTPLMNLRLVRLLPAPITNSND